MHVELAIFDLGRATVHTGEDPTSRCLRDALAGVGLDVAPDALRSVRGLPRLHALRVLVGASPETATLQQQIGAIHLDAVARLTAFYQSDPSLRETPGTAALFAALRAGGVRVSLASDLSRALTDAVVERLGWIRDGLLGATIAADEAWAAPDRDGVLALMRHARVTNARAVARVSADPAGLAQGRAAGCGLVIALASDDETASALAGARPTHVARSADEVASLLGASLAR